MLGQLLRTLFFPHAPDITSRKWSWYVNSLAASRMLLDRHRIRIYRWLGMELESDRVKPGCFFQSTRIRLGRDSSINHNCFIENVEHVDIGERTDIGYGVRIITSTHAIGDHSQRAGEWWPYPVRVGNGCWIGVGATILPGVTIGDGCVIAAGTVVTRDCEPDGLYAGVPAKRVRELTLEDGRISAGSG